MRQINLPSVRRVFFVGNALHGVWALPGFFSGSVVQSCYAYVYCSRGGHPMWLHTAPRESSVAGLPELSVRLLPPRVVAFSSRALTSTLVGNTGTYWWCRVKLQATSNSATASSTLTNHDSQAG